VKTDPLATGGFAGGFTSSLVDTHPTNLQELLRDLQEEGELAAGREKRRVPASCNMRLTASDGKYQPGPCSSMEWPQQLKN
jgi:hypothetical protein